MPRWNLLLLTLTILGLGTTGQAQLAITEVMSVAKENSDTGFRGAEYWELTNFGANDVDLHGFGFRDSNSLRPLTRDPFTNLVIRAGKSIIFFRVPDAFEPVNTLAQFHAWWGETQLPADLQARAYQGPGLSGWDGDAVCLYDAFGQQIDRAEFGRARPGRAFTYEAERGLFPVLSAPELDGAVLAVLAKDIGSPGSTTGPVPVGFLQEPSDQSADAGTTVRFDAAAAGMPRPRYQWFVDSRPIPSATGPTLILPAVGSEHVGLYQVRIYNGLNEATSSPAALTINTNPTAPIVLVAPADATLFPRQTAKFAVSARGLPAPNYQWQANGFDMPGATGPALEVANVSSAHSGIIYTVRISNSLGATNASATLIVSPWPDVRFTEVMARPANEEENRHFDWFELTNFDSNAVDLTSWRFSDEPSFARAFTVTNALVLNPGESVVFVERLDVALFTRWWGTENAPPGLKVVTYSGFSLKGTGETLYLWNAAATDPHDPVATVAWAAATEGVSFECEHYCDPEGFGCLDEATFQSMPGLRGAFRAVDGGDIGSPGLIQNAPPRVLSIVRTATEIRVRCRVAEGGTYRLSRTPALGGPLWTPLDDRTATDQILTLIDNAAGPVQFYRVEEFP